MTLLIPEVIEKMRNARSVEELYGIYHINKGPVLDAILLWTYTRLAKFDVVPPKTWKEDPRPIQLSINSLFNEWKRLYIFSDVRKDIPAAKKTDILLNILETMHPTESQLLLEVLKKDLHIPLMTIDIMENWFPGRV